MRKYTKKRYVWTILLIIIIPVLIKCNAVLEEAKPLKGYARPLVNYEAILNSKGCSVKEESAVKNIIYGLSASEFLISASCQTSEPYSINIYYKDFKYIDIEVYKHEAIKVSSRDIIFKNSAVIFALVQDVQVINYYFDDNLKYTDTRDEVISNYGKEALDKMTESDAKLGRFYDLVIE